MADVISLEQRRQRRIAEEHARALVMFECAAALARQAHPALMQLIEQSYGREWIDQRVKETLTPRRRREPTTSASKKASRPAR